MNPEFESIQNFDRLRLGLSVAQIAVRSTLGREQHTEVNPQNYPGVIVLPTESYPTQTVDLSTIEFDA